MGCDVLTITQKTGWGRRRQNRKQEGQLRGFYSSLIVNYCLGQGGSKDENKWTDST